MPKQAILPDFEHVDFEQEPFVEEESERFSVKKAGNLVMQTFDSYSRNREQNIERNWRRNEQLYFGMVKKRFWQGSNIPRSSLPVPIVQDQLETALPEIVGSIFEVEPYFFEAVSETGSDPKAAEAARARISYALEFQGDFDGRTGISELKRAARSCGMYGNGYVEVGYDQENLVPYVEWLDIRDVYLAPNTGNWVEGTPSWIKRRWMTVDELKEFKGSPGFDIPSDDKLNALAKNPSFEGSDMDEVYTSLLQGHSKDLDQRNPNPVRQGIEVLIYQSKERVIWVLGRKHVAYNQPNPWNMITLCGAPYIQVLGQQEGRSLGDLLENEQKLAQALTNGYLDEIALNLNPPRTALSSALGHPSQLAFRPGALYRSSTPKEDFIPQFTGRVTQDVWQALSEVERRSSRRTGISELSQSGVPTPSNANRTATGIRQNLGATSRRLFTPVDNFETYLLIPCLRKMHKIISMTETRGQFPGKLPSGETGMVESQQAAAPVRIKLNAASKMAARQQIAGMLPFLIQYLLNPQIMQEARKEGKVTDFDEITRMVQDATGTRNRYAFFRQMTDEERQAAAQPQPEEQGRMAEKQLDAQVRREVAALKAETERLKIEADSEAKTEEIAVKIIEILQGGELERLKQAVAAKKEKSAPTSSFKK